ncbi:MULTISPECIES: TRAP transporter substrate-binding protein [unclassified Paenibacillus]|uniref:TRAP transporter substrate-binding protein n=1 Tax=unclassified Paenibacillus TaxID=185978 RepID=UPI001AE7199A|nr:MULTISPECIES: TRAP transporter substrate-binding protein [unclassified Paenibacillus]MBP1155755.1 tripartite ATP-independent transporter DctP family solute receptor [Paenibacillus sp. PvP091]MBP1168859.1 tripartite ATP-independent transporter DctP family solute receptor [Paenibacillus sp. PvR098]MBP2439887.1 tripartite ATP-independent transporter DctP family solute receptor [Paenibacillus sp. PvP052]
MKLLKRNVFISLVLVLLAGCGSNPSQGDVKTDNGTSNNVQTKKLTFALDQSPSDSWSQATRKFADLVKEKTQGSITIQVHDSGTLGAQRQALEGILAGTIHGTVTLEPVSYWVEDIGIYGIPYLFRDQSHLDQFLASKSGDELHQKMTDAGFRPMTYFKRPPRHITSNKPINTLADLKGLKIRVPETPTAPPAFKAMGAAPVAMPFSEVYSALDTHVIDGQENPLPTTFSNKFQEVQKYVALTGHQYQVAYLVLSDKIYASLTDAEKKAIDEAAKEAQQFESETVDKNMKTIEADMIKAGVTFTKPDTKPFAEAAQTAYSGYSKLMQDWIQKIQSLN